MVTLRRARWPDDVVAVANLDTGFVTDRIYRLMRNEWSSELVAEANIAPLAKRYPLNVVDQKERSQWDCAVVAEAGGTISGFLAAQYQAWNRRLIIQHLYVEPSNRGRGVGISLLDYADEHARKTGARCLWLETQNVNFPAIQFYLKYGFHYCGFDESLYDPIGLDSDEVALFFSKHIA